MEVAKPSALERKQRANGHNFTWKKFCLWVLGYVPHPVINGAKEMCNNVFGLHESLLENGLVQLTFLVKALVKQRSRIHLIVFNHLATSTNS